MTTNRLTTPWWALRAALGAAAFLAGLDKYFNLLVGAAAAERVPTSTILDSRQATT